MTYTPEITAKIVKQYSEEGISALQIAEALTLELGETITERSVIAKLSHLGVYKKKEYLTKRGEVPIKKSEYIDMLAGLLKVDSETLESLEKVNKSVLQLFTSKFKGLAWSASPTNTNHTLVGTLDSDKLDMTE